MDEFNGSLDSVSILPPYRIDTGQLTHLLMRGTSEKCIISLFCHCVNISVVHQLRELQFNEAIILRDDDNFMVPCYKK